MLRFFIVFLLIISCVFGENNSSKKDILYTNLLGMAVITTWGVAKWEYGKRQPHADNEAWFERETNYAGADKLGHFYASYLMGSALSGVYENWGYSEKEAALYGSVSSLFLMNYMEIGDSTSSEFGFSYEDFIMNTLGSLGAYFFYINPELAKRMDLRLEYVPSFKTEDIVTEYERMKYLIAFKAEGFDFISNPYFRYAELHLGYYTRNYKGGYSQESERIIYCAIGINLSRVARENEYGKTARLLNYYQIPYVYLPFEKELNR